jgi:hypothetical protein
LKEEYVLSFNFFYFIHNPKPYPITMCYRIIQYNFCLPFFNEHNSSSIKDKII